MLNQINILFFYFKQSPTKVLMHFSLTNFTGTYEKNDIFISKETKELMSIIFYL